MVWPNRARVASVACGVRRRVPRKQRNGL